MAVEDLDGVYEIKLSYSLSFPEPRSNESVLYPSAYLEWVQRSPLGMWLEENIGEAKSRATVSLPAGNGWYIVYHPAVDITALRIDAEYWRPEYLTDLLLRFT